MSVTQPTPGICFKMNDVNLNDHTSNHTYFVKAATGQEYNELSEKHDQIAKEMWRDYQHVLATRDLKEDESDDILSTDDEDSLATLHDLCILHNSMPM